MQPHSIKSFPLPCRTVAVGTQSSLRVSRLSNGIWGTMAQFTIQMKATRHLASRGGNLVRICFSDWNGAREDPRQHRAVVWMVVNQSQSSSFFLNLFLFILSVCAPCGCRYPLELTDVSEDRRGQQISWSWSSGQTWVPEVGSENRTGSSVKAASTSEPWVQPPGSPFLVEDTSD